jgi:thiol-disulfide isomerase/thioredoxin
MRLFELSKLILIILFTAFSISCNESSNSGLGPGKNPPYFELLDLKNNKVKLEHFRGRVVLINFWATWCGPCINEIPQLNYLVENFSKEQFALLGIAVEGGGTLFEQQDRLKGFAEKHKIKFKILIDQDGKTASDYKVNGFPESFILDQDGKLQMIKDPNSSSLTVKIIGPREWGQGELLSQISRLVNTTLKKR